MIIRLPSNMAGDKLLALNEAFFRLSNNQDFKTVLEWLKLEKLRLSEENMITKSIQFKRIQGALQALTDILTMSDREEAAKIVEKLRK